MILVLVTILLPEKYFIRTILKEIEFYFDSWFLGFQSMISTIMAERCGRGKCLTQCSQETESRGRTPERKGLETGNTPQHYAPMIYLDTFWSVLYYSPQHLSICSSWHQDQSSQLWLGTKPLLETSGLCISSANQSNCLLWVVHGF